MEKRRGRLRALGAELPKIAAPVLGKRGFASGQLVSEWAAVVGADLADKIAPDRLTFPRGERQDGTLRLRVSSAFAPEAQHRTPQLIERINGFFGYRAIARVVLVQGPLPRSGPPAVPRPRPLAAPERAALDHSLAGIEDSSLRDALRRLGEAVIGSAKR